jgi:hypothetical protein
MRKANKALIISGKMKTKKARQGRPGLFLARRGARF